MNVPEVILDDAGKIEVATEEAFNELVKECREQGLKVAVVPLAHMTADGVAGQQWKDACRAMVKRLLEISTDRM